LRVQTVIPQGNDVEKCHRSSVVKRLQFQHPQQQQQASDEDAIVLRNRTTQSRVSVMPRLHDEANIETNPFNIHVHGVCSKFASYLLHRVNGVLVVILSQVLRYLKYFYKF